MATHDYDIANQNGANFRTDLNSLLAAIVSNNSNATSPSTTFAFMWWADTANDILKQRNAANSAWINILTLSTGVSLQLPNAAGISFTTTSDLSSTDVNAAIEEVKSLPSGVNWAGNTKTASFSATKANGYLVSGAGITATLPASPADGDVVVLADYDGTWDVNPITIAGGTVEGDTDFRLDLRGAQVQLVYSGTSTQWELTASGAGAAQEILDHTAASGLSSYTLPWAPASESSIDVYVGNVWQSPDAFTLTGTALDFGTAITGELRVRLNGFALPIGTPGAGTVGVSQMVPAVDAVYSRGRKNLLINGTGRIRQRSQGTTVSGDFGTDRWQLQIAGLTGSLGVSDDFSVSKVGKAHMFLQSTVVDASPAVGDYHMLAQRIEGLNMRHLRMGQSDAKSFTLSFRAVASQNSTVSVAFRNDGDNRSYVTTVALTTDVQDYSVTVPGDTTGTWPSGPVTGLMVSFIHTASQSGTFTTSTLNAWQAGNYIAANTQTNGADTFNRFMSISDIQLEEGTVATPYDHVSYGVEFLECKRYYEQRFVNGNSYHGQYTSGSGASFIGQTVSFGVEKRTAPTVGYVYSSGSQYWTIVGSVAYSANSNTGITFTSSNTSWSMNQTRQVGNSVPTSGNLYCFEPSFWVTADAEL